MLVSSVVAELLVSWLVVNLAWFGAALVFSFGLFGFNPDNPKLRFSNLGLFWPLGYLDFVFKKISSFSYISYFL